MYCSTSNLSFCCQQGASISTHHCLICGTRLDGAADDTDSCTDLEPAESAQSIADQSSEKASEKPAGKEDPLHSSYDVVGMAVPWRCWVGIKVQARVEGRLAHCCNDYSKPVTTKPRSKGGKQDHLSSISAWRTRRPSIAGLSRTATL